jgi:hypothetical protein
MSAFLHTPQHIGVLAALTERLAQRNHDSTFSAVKAAREWAFWNLRSMAERYYNGNETAVANDNGYENPADYVNACVFWAKAPLPRRIDPAYNDVLKVITWVVKMAQSLEYQSCEFEGWRQHEGFNQLDRAFKYAQYSLPGYDDAPWSYDGEDDPATLAATTYTTARTL